MERHQSKVVKAQICKILGSLLKNLVASTLPLPFETVVTVTLNWEKCNALPPKSNALLSVPFRYFCTYAPPRSLRDF